MRDQNPAVLEAKMNFRSMRLSLDPARGFMGVTHLWRNSILDAVRWLFSTLTPGHVFLILSFCWSHFYACYSHVHGTAWWKIVVCEHHLLLGCWFYPPSGLTVIFPLFLGLAQVTNITKVLLFNQEFYFLIMCSSQQLLLFLVAFIVLTRFINIF